MISPRLISRCGKNGSDFPGAKMNLLTSRWSPIVMVFCIEPVGTFTAWTMKVMPNSAMMTVTTADSKYSRQTVLGGPCGFTDGTGCLSWPLRLNRDPVEGFSSSVSSLVVEILLLVRLVAIQKHPKYVTGGGQV